MKGTFLNSQNSFRILFHILFNSVVHKIYLIEYIHFQLNFILIILLKECMINLFFITQDDPQNTVQQVVEHLIY